MKSLKLLNQSLAAVVIGVCSASATAADIDQVLQSQKHLWAKANYQLQDDAREQAFERLMLESKNALSEHPKSAEAWAWSGIIKSSFAAVKGGLGALSLVKEAKKDFEKAIALDENVLNGATYASLGVLYHKVPGWPVGFGSDDKAEKFFKKAMSIGPKGRESNFFYGEFLYNEGKYIEAKAHLLTAKNVSQALWKDRPVAYKYRQEQIEDMLAKVDDRLAKRNKRRR